MKNTGFTRKLMAVIAAATMMAAAAGISAAADNKAYIISGDEFRSAYSTTGENTIDYVTFKEMGGYELQFNFKLNSGITKTYTASSPMLKSITAYIPMQDMLNKLKIAPEDISEISITGASYDNVKGMSLSLDKQTTVTSSTVTGTTTSPAADDDKNPATGVDDLVLPLLITGAFGTAAVACGIAGTKKRK